jgi:tetratricopeptide (TPR) repeat protein
VELGAAVASEYDNLRAALEWARDAGADEVLLRLTAALAYYWGWRGLYQETDMWVPLALGRAASPVEARMKVLSRSVSRARDKGEYARADVVVEEWRRLADQAGDDVQLLRAMNSAALTATERGDFDDARAKFAAVRDRAGAIGDRDGVALAAVHLALVADRCGDFDAALDYAAEAVELFRELGDDGGVGVALGNYAWAALGQSDLVRAEASFREACAVFARLGAIHRIVNLAPALAWILAARNEEEPAAQLLDAAAFRREELGIRLLDEDDQIRHDEAVAAAKAALGEEAFAAAWARGEAMTPEEILAFTMPE